MRFTILFCTSFLLFFSAANASPKAILPKDLFKKLTKQVYEYKETGLAQGFASIQSCVFTTDDFVLLRNYCFPRKNYPAKGYTIFSPELGVFELYEEIENSFQFRNFRMVVFQDDISQFLAPPIKEITLEKINRIISEYRGARGRACWATNLSRYTGTEDVNCYNEDINVIPKWKKAALDFVNDKAAWEDLFEALNKVAVEPFELSLTQIYEGRGDIYSEALFTPMKRYADISNTLFDLERKYPQNAQVFELAKSNTGESIYGLKIGNGAVSNLVVGTHHGNEYGAAEVAEAFAIETAKNPIAGQTVYVIPVLNVNGYDRRSRSERTEAGLSYDPNRDYPGPCGTSGPFHLNSTKALADFVGAADIVNSVTLHTYYPGVLYPWGISTHDLDTGYDELFKQLSFAAASFSNYKVGNSTEELYPADGTFEDFAFWKYGVWSLLFEMGYTHSPSPQQIQDLIAGNVPGIRKFFEEAPSQRASDHSFKGQCNGLSILFDRRDE